MHDLLTTSAGQWVKISDYRGKHTWIKHPFLITQSFQWPETTSTWELLRRPSQTFITSVNCFLDWPRHPFTRPQFIIRQAKWLSRFLCFSSQSVGEFPAKGQMVEDHPQRKLCLSAAIVVVCSPAGQLAEQQRAVVNFQISNKSVWSSYRMRVLNLVLHI